MKRVYKVLLALGAVVGLMVLALIALVRGAFSVADAALDTTANTVDAVTAKMKAPDSPVSNAPKNDNTSLAQVTDTTDANALPQKSDSTANTPVKTEGAPAVQAAPTSQNKPQPDTPQAARAKDNKGGAEEDDTLVVAGKIFGFLLGDGDEDLNPAAILNAGDNPQQDSSTPRDNKAGTDENVLAGVIPGADSPTLQKALTGKYKGKEDQIIDDALEDPKAWRLLFFLGGGM